MDLYQELLSDFTKTASDVAEVKKQLEDFDIAELEVLAAEMDKLAASGDASKMAEILPVYKDTKHVDKVKEECKEENQEVKDEEKEAEEVTDEVEKEAEEAAEETTGEVTEEVADEATEEVVEEAPVEEAKEAEEVTEEVVEKSASEQLHEILQAGAALEDMIEARAAEMVENLLKEAALAEEAQAIAADLTVNVLGKEGSEAEEFYSKFLDKVASLSESTEETVNVVAEKLASKVKEGIDKTAKTVDTEEVEKEAEEVANDIPKLSAEADIDKQANQESDAVESMLVEAGRSQGLAEAPLFEFVQKTKDKIRTVQARTSKSLLEAAQLVLSGADVGETGYSSQIAPPASVAGYSDEKQVINANVTDSPDQFITEESMVGQPQAPQEVPQEAQAGAPEEIPQSQPTEEDMYYEEPVGEEPSEYDQLAQLKSAAKDELKQLLKEAILKGL